MKYAAAITIVSIAFVSQAFAVLRPLFPAKTVPPFNGGRSSQETVGSEICRSKRLLQLRNKRCASRKTQIPRLQIVYFSRVLSIAHSSNDSPRISERVRKRQKGEGWESS